MVVGDQSSGKSSLLEALTGIQFPVASTLCTRFATQISFRRTVDEKITVSLIPSKDSAEDRKKKLRSFSDTVDVLTGDKFMELMEKVCPEWLQCNLPILSTGSISSNDCFPGGNTYGSSEAWRRILVG